MATTTPDQIYIRPLPQPVRWLLIALGFLSVGIGLIGTVIPGLPTTIFMIIAALCFGRASDRWYRWLMTRKFVGKHFHSMMQGRGLPMRIKMIAIAACWACLIVLALFMVKSSGGRIGLVVTALIQAAVVLRLPTFVEEPAA
jgi:uncharacterized membrane protein YbaN (DUF454 family)